MSRAGGITRIRLHGNPGTPEGRRLGGQNSIKIHKKTGSGFKVLRKVLVPKDSEWLAELLGILAGDGHIGEYQVSVVTNSSTDLEHAWYIQRLFEKIFCVKTSLSFRTDSKACVVVVSSRDLGSVLVKKGMQRGHKIKSDLCMPDWVRKSPRYRKAFARGLFDTDGSVYLDTHHIKGKTYKNICMLFTNRCLPLLLDFKSTLESIDLRPTQKTKYAVFLRRKRDIQAYFKVIGSSNPKHLKKIQRYFS